jgi:type VI secretion system secreted protein Hcp
MAVDQFLKLEGIDGESIDANHTKSIGVLAWSWGISQGGTTHLGVGAGSGKANFMDLSFTKYIDSSSHALIKFCTEGGHIPTGQLTVRKAGGTALEYFIIMMEDIIVTSVSTGGSGGEDMLAENCSLNFARWFVSYAPQKADGTGDAAKEFGYDIPGSAVFTATVERK